MRVKRGISVLLLAAVCILTACSAENTGTTQKSTEGFPVFSEIPIGELPEPSYPKEQGAAVSTQEDNNLAVCAEFGSEIMDYIELEEAAVAEIASIANAESYASEETEGAVLRLENDGSFSYALARQYIHLADDAYSFDMTFRASGYLLPAEGGVQLCITDATITCEGLNTERNTSILSYANNQGYSSEELKQYAQLISGESLTVDEFYGIGTFAQMTAYPLIAVIDEENRSFTLNRVVLDRLF